MRCAAAVMQRMLRAPIDGGVVMRYNKITMVLIYCLLMVTSGAPDITDPLLADSRELSYAVYIKTLRDPVIFKIQASILKELNSNEFMTKGNSPDWLALHVPVYDLTVAIQLLVDKVFPAPEVDPSRTLRTRLADIDELCKGLLVILDKNIYVPDALRTVVKYIFNRKKDALWCLYLDRVIPDLSTSIRNQLTGRDVRQALEELNFRESIYLLADIFDSDREGMALENSSRLRSTASILEEAGILPDREQPEWLRHGRLCGNRSYVAALNAAFAPPPTRSSEEEGLLSPSKSPSSLKRGGSLTNLFSRLKPR